MTSKRGSIPFFNSDSNDHGGVAASHFLEERDARPAASAPAKSAPRSGYLIDRFEAMIARSGGTRPERPACREAYARWAALGVAERDMEIAICLVTLGGEATFDPLELDSSFTTAAALKQIRSYWPAEQHDLIADYEASLKAAGGIFLATDVSREIFASWKQAKVSKEAVQQAIAARAQQTNAPPRPGDLNEWLFPTAPKLREEQKNAMRGRVAL